MSLLSWSLSICRLVWSCFRSSFSWVKTRTSSRVCWSLSVSSALSFSADCRLDSLCSNCVLSASILSDLSWLSLVFCWSSWVLWESFKEKVWQSESRTLYHAQTDSRARTPHSGQQKPVSRRQFVPTSAFKESKLEPRFSASLERFPISCFIFSLSSRTTWYFCSSSTWRASSVWYASSLLLQSSWEAGRSSLVLPISSSKAWILLSLWATSENKFSLSEVLRQSSSDFSRSCRKTRQN